MIRNWTDGKITINNRVKAKNSKTIMKISAIKNNYLQLFYETKIAQQSWSRFLLCGVATRQSIDGADSLRNKMAYKNNCVWIKPR